MKKNSFTHLRSITECAIMDGVLRDRRLANGSQSVPKGQKELS